MAACLLDVPCIENERRLKTWEEKQQQVTTSKRQHCKSWREDTPFRLFSIHIVFYDHPLGIVPIKRIDAAASRERKWLRTLSICLVSSRLVAKIHLSAFALSPCWKMARESHLDQFNDKHHHMVCITYHLLEYRTVHTERRLHSHRHVLSRLVWVFIFFAVCFARARASPSIIQNYSDLNMIILLNLLWNPWWQTYFYQSGSASLRRSVQLLLLP